MNTSKKGFTLIELLVVIGILAILATVVIVVLNPAQLFQQGRDSKRVADLAGLRSAIVLYMATASSPDLDGSGGAFTCGTHFGATLSGVTTTFVTASTLAQGGVFSVAGLGWVPINFSGTTGGSPLGALPRDPSNATTTSPLYYTYSCNNASSTFELNANMESSRYSNGGADDVESRDGGDNANLYEVGNAPGLAL